MTVFIVHADPEHPTTPTSQYLELTHPQPGRLFVCMDHPKKKWVQEHADTAEQALAIITKFEAQKPAGVFVSQASFDFQTNKRETKLAQRMSCFFLDFDVGSGADKYETKAEALAALHRLQKEFMPATVVVDTGGGYHAYWFLRAVIPARQWLPIAQRFKRALKAAGVRTDPTATADLARVLRVPGTINRKTDTDRPCQFIEYSGKRCSAENFSAAIAEFEKRHGISDSENRTKASTTQVTALLSGTRPTTTVALRPMMQLGVSPPPSPTVADVELACPAIQALSATGGLTEEAWSLGIINNAAFTADPEAAAQVWSAAHAGYKPSEVTTKLTAKQRATRAPTTCLRMAELDDACAQACGTCQYRGQVSTPIHAGQKLAAAKRGIALQHGNNSETVSVGSTSEPVFGYTETGNAQRMHRAVGNTIAWVHELNTWLHFVECRWHAITDVQMVALATPVMQQMYVNAAATTSAAEAKAMAAHASKSLGNSSLNNTVSLLKSRPGVEIRAGQLDANDMELGTADGQVIDLVTGRARAQQPGDYITKATGCNFDPAATCPTWLAFLDSLFRGGVGAQDENDDQGLIRYLQLWIGYALTGLTREQQFQFAHGLGANGKSVLYSILQELFGSYCLQSQPEAFMLKQSGEGATPLLARLQGARLVIAPEVEDGQRLAESTVKQLTGGDTIVARTLYGSPFEFKPKFKLVIVGNHKPLIRGDDYGIWRRVHMLPFTRVFEPHEQDRQLSAKLRQELPGILNWAIGGCLLWQRAGRLDLPAIMLREAQEYRSEMDLIAQWLDDSCQVAPDLKTAGSVAYASFQNWCKQNGSVPFNSRRFGQKLKERGFTPTRTNSARGWDGFTCRQSMFAGLI